jgi:NAD+ kinase
MAPEVAGDGIRRVGFVVHIGRPAAVETASGLIAWFGRRGVATRGLEGEGPPTDDSEPVDRFPIGIDLVVSVGGDGTLLRAARLAATADVPLVGVNVGRVGFLTQVTPAGATELLERVMAGIVELDERTAIVARPELTTWTDPQWALNEVIVEKKARHRLITLRARVGKEDVATFSGDGVMVATPTGSTAYSFSARGPIVSPRVDCLLLTPVSPHMVFDRSIVLDPGQGVELQVLGDEPGLLSADGRRGLELPAGSRVLIQRSEHPVRLVRSPDSPSFFALLRDKFSLPGQAPHAAPEGEWSPEPSASESLGGVPPTG